ncbi:hypothetical protein [Nocardioides sp. zg-1228]|uniref:hypothetical protein n=1 Tax=Nocardioides sp. zg-1228 TaxID=2763008 RepID=UPI001642BD0D|nr:hypothetical protein [Nocardioides sp. zg-1228]MBC2931783.1 hypothetical protein [Nocardioides sp. zg-1228]QSF57360.1 hypothetical protein JX575_17725 [Nocardioides sp. zg-1228]
MPTGPRTRTPLAAVLATALLLGAGCSDTPGEGERGTEGTGGGGAGGKGTSGPPDDTAWTTSSDPVEAGGLVWASGGVVHLSDGTTVDVGGPMATYVVAGDGVYFTPAASDAAATEHGSMTTGPLRFADRDGVSDTGLTVYVESIGSSPDGRYVGFVDATSGPADRFSGHPRGTAVVVDLTSGERVVETADAMGDPEQDDLARDYAEVDLGVRFADAGSAVVEGLGDVLVSLPDGEVTPTDQSPRSPADPVSPDGAWSIDDRGLDDRIVSREGRPVPVRTGTPRRDLRWWLDDSTVVGIAISGPATGQQIGPGTTSTLVTCQVPDGRCTPVDGTTDERILFPVGAGDEALDLDPTGGGS